MKHIRKTLKNQLFRVLSDFSTLDFFLKARHFLLSGVRISSFLAHLTPLFLTLCFRTNPTRIDPTKIDPTRIDPKGANLT